MVEIPTSLRSLFSGKIEKRDGQYLLEIPESEVKNGAIDPSETLRVALLDHKIEAEETPSSNTQESGGTIRL